MNAHSLLGRLIFLLAGLLLLAACAPAAAVPTVAITAASVSPTAPAVTTVAPAATTAPGVVATSAAPTAGLAAAGYSAPFAYCAAAGTIDQPDARYTGPKTPEAVVTGMMKASGAAPDAPLDAFSQGTFWRCMNGQVYACFVGANLPCESKANTSQQPTPEMNDFCTANPASDFIPAAVTGHDTIYEWACKNGQAVAGQQVFHVDPQGYIQEIWYKIDRG